MAGTPTSGVINSSYVSKRKPIAATIRINHCVTVNGFCPVEFMALMYDVTAGRRQGFCPYTDDFDLNAVSNRLQTGNRIMRSAGELFTTVRIYSRTFP